MNIPENLLADGNTMRFRSKQHSVFSIPQPLPGSEQDHAHIPRPKEWRRLTERHIATRLDLLRQGGGAMWRRSALLTVLQSVCGQVIASTLSDSPHLRDKVQKHFDIMPTKYQA